MAAVPPRIMATAGAKSRPRNWAARAVGTLCFLHLPQLLSLGCTPSVAARAVWIGSAHDVDGGRTLFAYSAGSFTSSHIAPLAGEADAEVGELPLLLELEPRGRGVLVRAVDSGWLHEIGTGSTLRAGYVDLAHERVLPLALPSGRDAASFLAAGDGLWWFEDCPRALAVLPLAPELVLAREGEAGTVAPLRHLLDASAGKPAARACNPGAIDHAVVSAADAPRLFLIAARGTSPDLRAEQEATIELWQVPRGDGAAQLQRVVQGSLPAGHVPVRLPGLQCSGGPACPIAAVDPDGMGLTLSVYGAGCRLLRFDAASGAASCAVADDAPAELAAARMVAAISSDHYVFHDGLTLLLHDWRTGKRVLRTLPGDPDDAFVRVTQDGRAVVLGSSRGPVLRGDAEGLDVLSLEQGLCPNPQPPVLSPSGAFVAWTCTISPPEDGTLVNEDEPSADALSLGDVIRVSGAGLERYQGVPMWALAIDDSGDLLIHSRKNPRLDHETLLPPDPPRNLYVLARDGELARIDGLEPDPEQSVGLAQDSYQWIASQAL